MNRTTDSKLKTDKKAGYLSNLLRWNKSVVAVVSCLCLLGTTGAISPAHSHAQGNPRVNTWDSTQGCLRPDTTTCFGPNLAPGNYDVFGQLKCDGPSTVGVDGPNGEYRNHYWLELVWHPTTVGNSQYHSWINAVHVSTGGNYAPVPGVGIWPANGQQCALPQPF
ncbi:MAG TPA: hypothetical protein VGS08_03140 [Candidatus Saccharimonadales bacterium]|nr:hypothetical protein [Candidatus Saccharimonadales bacterium]